MNLIARCWSRPVPLGLDIGSDAVRLLQLADDGAGWQVTHYACESLPPGAVVERQIADIEAVGAAIARARSGSQARHAVVALAAPAAVLRLVSAPAGLNDADLEVQLELEAARHLPAGNGLPHLDFEVLGPMQEDPDWLQVLLAVAHAAPVRQYAAALKLAGLNIRAVDVEALALARALAMLAAQPLPVEQVISLNRQTANLPDSVNRLLAKAIPPQEIENAASALLLACGLALWGEPV